jgi:hypothetical protein
MSESIIRIGAGAAPLSKLQQEFNRLTERIATAERDLADLTRVADSLNQRLRADYEPLWQQYMSQRADLILLLDRAHQAGEFSSQENKKLANLILETGEEMAGSRAFERIESVLQRYKTVQTTAAESEVMIPQTDEPNARVERPEPAGNTTAERPRSEKGQARMAKKLALEQQTTRSVRAVYMDLVKAFHPDREPDEAEKIRKTSIMQRVTEAYQQGDLLALLRLQLDLARIDPQHLESLADTQLRYYNKLLNRQLEDLESRQQQLVGQLTNLHGRPLPRVNLRLTLEITLNQDINSLKRAVKEGRQELKWLADRTVLRQWLKSYDR